MWKLFFPLVKISTVRLRCSGMKSLSLFGTEKKMGAVHTGQQREDF